MMVGCTGQYYQDVQSVVNDLLDASSRISSAPALLSQPLTPLQKEAILLLADKQYASCEFLARLDLSKCQKENRSEQVDIGLLAECAFQQGKWVAARDLYETLYLWDEHTYRYKVACCMQKIGSIIEAVCILEKVPKEMRTLKIHMLLGNLLMAQSRKHQACECYLEVLKINPYTIEAIYALAAAGADKQKSSSALDIGHAKHGEQENLITKEMLQVLHSKHRHQTALALQQVETLVDEYPNNLPLMTLQAELYLQSSDIARAGEVYTAVHVKEPNYLVGMDQYADVLGQTERISELSGLADRMLQIDDKSPIAWTCLALYHKHAYSGSNEQSSTNALKLIDKAISLDQRHAFAHYVRGKILLDSRRPDYAGVSFFRSNEIEPTIATYEGLVDAYLEASKEKEAIAAAKEIFHLTPRDPRSLTLVGLALAQGSRAQAKRSLKKALNLSPALSRPLFCLIEIHHHDKEYEACLQLLQDALAVSSTSTNHSNIATADEILRKMGDIYALKEEYNEAIGAYNRSLAINPTSRAAMDALDRLEKLMKGIDPNENSDDIVEDAASHEAESPGTEQPSSSYYPSSP